MTLSHTHNAIDDPSDTAVVVDVVGDNTTADEATFEAEYVFDGNVADLIAAVDDVVGIVERNSTGIPIAPLVATVTTRDIVVME